MHLRQHQFAQGNIPEWFDASFMQREFVSRIQEFIPTFYANLIGKKVEHFIKNSEW